MLRCLKSSNFESRTERELRTLEFKRPQQQWQDNQPKPTNPTWQRTIPTDRPGQVNCALPLLLGRCLSPFSRPGPRRARLSRYCRHVAKTSQMPQIVSTKYFPIRDQDTTKSRPPLIGLRLDLTRQDTTHHTTRRNAACS